MRDIRSTVTAVACAAGLIAAAADPVAAACTRLGFSVNDYGKDGPTQDAKDLLDKYIAKTMSERGIANYRVGKKEVNCELYIDLILFDEHTCRADATVCWDGSPLPKNQETTADGAATKKSSSGDGSATKKAAKSDSGAEAKKPESKSAKTADKPVESPQTTTGSIDKSEPAAAAADKSAGETTATPEASKQADPPAAVEAKAPEEADAPATTSEASSSSDETSGNAPAEEAIPSVSSDSESAPLQGIQP